MGIFFLGTEWGKYDTFWGKSFFGKQRKMIGKKGLLQFKKKRFQTLTRNV